MKKAIALVVFVGIAGLLGWKIHQKVTAAQEGSAPRRGGAAVAVEVGAVRTGTVERIERLSGTLRPRLEYIVAPKIAGRLAKLLVNIGDRVGRDQEIAVLDAAELDREVERARAELQVAKANAEEIRFAAALDDAELAQKAEQAKAALGSAKAKVEEARSGLAVAERELRRAETLRKKEVLSDSDLDEKQVLFEAAKAKYGVARAEVTHKEAALAASQVRLSETQKNARAAEYQLAAAQVAQKEAALKAAEVRASYARITAPWQERKNDGAAGSEAEAARDVRVIGERFVDEGAMLKANDPIVTVVAIGELKAVVHVTERDYPKVRPGQSVTVTTDAFPRREFAGTIARVAPVLKEASRQARVEIRVPNPERRLKPGMYIRAKIVLDTHANVTVVPRNALVRRDRKQGVFLADREELTAEFIQVEVGIAEGEVAEIVDPPARLKSGWVVTLGHHLLENGSSITLPELPQDREGEAASAADTSPSMAPAKTKEHR